nr:hypothetical protein [Actinomadura madurae]
MLAAAVALGALTTLTGDPAAARRDLAVRSVWRFGVGAMAADDSS